MILEQTDTNPEWNKSILRWIYKGKGNISDPNNYRGICLQDVVARYLSSILSSRLLKMLDKEGIETQLGSQPGRGCRDALYILRSLLQVRRKHNLPSWTLFVDLEKAFDTVRHELLFKLLETYGIPEAMIDVIRRLYQNVTLKLSSGNAKDTIPYSVGVKQGDAMAPVLFIVLMQAMAETLKSEWEEADIQAKELRHFKDTPTHRGRMHGQDWKAKGTPFTIDHILYVDDGVFIFDSKNDMEKGARILKTHMARFGLIMHIGRDGKKSKTEAVYFPPPGVETTPEDVSQFGVDDDQGYITFTQKFQYLGSLFNTDLKDDREVTARINKANLLLRSLTNVWRNKNITLKTKVIFYKAFCLNTILWGCESIILTATIEHKLETFQHKAIRFILNINMHQVKDERMKNEKVRAMFGNIDKVCDFATRRRLDYIGHVLRQDDKKLTKKLLTCWIRCARTCGGQQSTLKDANFHAINSLLLSNNLPVSKDCPTASWAKEALDPAVWNMRVKKTKYVRPTRRARKNEGHNPADENQVLTRT